MKLFRWAVALALALAGCAATAPESLAPVAPEGASGWTAKAGVTAPHFMVAAANPLATEAGYQILKVGGSALDAAIAVQMVLTLVEPQSSGIGGGAFLMHWNGSAVQAWDGRETAPAAAGERLFLDPEGRPVPFAQAVYGGRAVATPGAVRMLEAAHRQHGRLAWPQLFEPAIKLAEQGFALSPRLHTMLAKDALLRQDPQARAYFYRASGDAHPVGHVLRNPALAAVLRALAARGSDALHLGPIAADLVARVRGHAVPGGISVADLANYAPVQREALCPSWRNDRRNDGRTDKLMDYRVCGFPPPSSGHLALMQILGMMERLPPVQSALQGSAPGAQWLHVYTEASRLAFADRALYIADPAFVSAPAGRWTSLLDDTYLRQRAALIGSRSMRSAEPGLPAGAVVTYAPMPAQAEHGTSHISVVDAEGRAVAMTTTIEAAFGARIMADGGTHLPGGYLLNNQMTDFALAPADAQGRPVANRVEPGKRPRSSMSPTLVFDARSGRLLMALGSAGGPAIIHFTAKTLVGTLQWGLDPQRAIDLPNFSNFNGQVLLEQGQFPAATVDALRARGHQVQQTELTSGLQAIQRSASGWSGGADPRREGAVKGD